MRDYEVIIPVYEPDKRLYIILKRLLKQSVKPQKINILLTISEKYGALEFMEGLAKNDIKSEIITVDTMEKQDFNHGGSR